MNTTNDHNEQQSSSIEDIIRLIDEKKLLLPEFQRDFKWPIEKSETLFDSIFQDLFIGSLIISKPKFDLACKTFDIRERGSKKHKARPQLYKIEDFENKNIYTLLDGQQRATSIYRALKGYDKIYAIFKNIETLSSPEYFNHDSKEVLVSYGDYIEGFDSSEPSDDVFYLRLDNLYESMDWREKKFESEFIAPVLDNLKLDNYQKDILTEYATLLHKDFRSDIVKRKNLLSVQLLNMGLEKFCLYFERSNSQGLNLSFTDIITAKIYMDFKLSSKIQQAISGNKHFNDGLVDTVVRYINFLANGEVTKKSILKDLKGEHFIEHWDTVINDLEYVQSWLETQNILFDVSEMPYKTMILPIVSFFQNLPKKEFSQATSQQLDVLKFWFYASILDNRYGGARHGSTNVVIKKDCELMRELAKGKYPEASYWSNIRIEYSFDELKKLDGSKSAKFLGISYFMWSKKRFLNLENNATVNINSNIEVHHIFPSSYLKKTFGEESSEFDYSDSVLNKIRINKLSNIKISDKSPKEYLAEIHKINPDVKSSLDSHFIADINDIIEGGMDKNYFKFIENRFKQIEPLFEEIKGASNKLINGINDNIWVK